MTIKEAQISEIKNIDLIYVFSTDSALRDDNNKYVGAKVVYEKTKVLSVDYQEECFEKFIKKILERYQKEKDRRKIILLGDLTKRLVSDSSFAVLGEEKKDESSQEGLPSFNTSSRDVRIVENYLQETLKVILGVLKKYETLKIEGIKGFNNRYVVRYMVGGSRKQCLMTLLRRDNGVDFRIGIIDGTSVDVTGQIVFAANRVVINWESKKADAEGHLVYDSEQDTAEKKVTIGGITAFYDDNKDTILQEDIDLIKFYFDLCELEVPSNILKVDDGAFILSKVTNLNENDEGVLFNNLSARVDFSEEEVRIIYENRNGLSKYNNQINVTLDQQVEEITIRRLNVESKPCLIIEHKKDGGFSYQVCVLDDDVKLTSPFVIVEKHNIDEEMTTLESVKEYVKKRGNK